MGASSWLLKCTDSPPPPCASALKLRRLRRPRACLPKAWKGITSRIFLMPVTNNLVPWERIDRPLFMDGGSVLLWFEPRAYF